MEPDFLRAFLIHDAPTLNDLQVGRDQFGPWISLGVYNSHDGGFTRLNSIQCMEIAQALLGAALEGEYEH